MGLCVLRDLMDFQNIELSSAGRYSECNIMTVSYSRPFCVMCQRVFNGFSIYRISAEQYSDH